MDAADLAFVPTRPLVGQVAIDGMGPNIGSDIVVDPDIPKHTLIKQRTICYMALAEEAETSAD